MDPNAKLRPLLASFRWCRCRRALDARPRRRLPAHWRALHPPSHRRQPQPLRQAWQECPTTAVGSGCIHPIRPGSRGHRRHQTDHRRARPEAHCPSRTSSVRRPDCACSFAGRSWRRRVRGASSPGRRCSDLEVVRRPCDFLRPSRTVCDRPLPCGSRCHADRIRRCGPLTSGPAQHIHRGSGSACAQRIRHTERARIAPARHRTGAMVVKMVVKMMVKMVVSSTTLAATRATTRKPTLHLRRAARTRGSRARRRPCGVRWPVIGRSGRSPHRRPRTCA